MIFWKILKHAFKLISRNVFVALKILTPFVLISFAFQALMFFHARYATPDSTASLKAIVIAYTLFDFISTIWIAVIWHRYVLIDEHPNFLPKFHSARILSYFLTVLLIILITLLASVPLFIANLIAPRTDIQSFLTIVISIVLFFVIATMFMRLLVALPGAALGSPISMRETWQITKGHGGTFFCLFLALCVISLPFKFVSFYLEDGPLLVALPWDTLTEFGLMLLGLSVLTTLYGHYIEKRPLVS